MFSKFKYRNYYLIFLTISIFLIANYFNKSYSIEDSLSCNVNINNLELEDNFQIIPEEIPIFPEINNIKCSGKIDRFEFYIEDIDDLGIDVTKFTKIYYLTSNNLLYLINIIFGFFLLLILKIKNYLLFLNIIFFQILLILEVSYINSMSIVYICFTKFVLYYLSKLISKKKIMVIFQYLFIITTDFYFTISFIKNNDVYSEYLLLILLFILLNYLRENKSENGKNFIFIFVSLFIYLPIIEYFEILNFSTNILIYIIYLLFYIFFVRNIKLKFSIPKILEIALLFFITLFLLNFFFANMDRYLVSIFALLTVFIISKFQLKKLFEALCLFTLITITIFFINYFYINFITNQTSESIRDLQKQNINVVHILFDGMPNEVVESFALNNQHDFDFYSNAFSTGNTTEKSLIDMFNGDIWDESENFEKYIINSINSPENLINKLNVNGVETYVYTEKHGARWNKNYVNFKNIYLNEGNKVNLEILYEFYGKNNPLVNSIANNSSGLSIMKYIKGYILDILKFQKFNEVDFYSKVPLLGFDNLAYAYRDYKNFNDENTYQFIHIIFPHEPFSINSDCTFEYDKYKTPDISYICNEALLNLIFEKFNKSNTVLIINGDHGPPILINNNPVIDLQEYIENNFFEYISERLHIGLIVKNSFFTLTDVDEIVTITKIYEIVLNQFQIQNEKEYSELQNTYTIPIEGVNFRFTLESLKLSLNFALSK